MAESTSTERPKRRRRIGLIVLVVLVLLLVAGAFEFKIIKIPRCDPDIQQEVDDWPPTEAGIYEEASRNMLRTLEQGVSLAPARVVLCNVAGAGAAQVVATSPNQARFLVVGPQQGWEYHFYHSVVVPETGDCVNAQVANRVEGLQVTPDPQNANMVWLQPPQALENGQTYMLTAGVAGSSDPNTVVRGVIVRPGAAAAP